MKIVRRSKTAVALGLVFLLVFTAACTPAVTAGEKVVTDAEPIVTGGEVVTPAFIEQEVNFRLLVSDEGKCY